MKYQAASFADGVFTVVCPHCTNPLAVDEAQLGQINEQLGGRHACPQPPCGKEIEFPSLDEVPTIMANAVAPVPESEAAATSSPTEPVSNISDSAGTVPAPPQANPPLPPEASSVSASASEPAASSAKYAEEDIVVGFGGSSSATLEREAAGLHRLSVKTILHSACVKGKEDTFDDEVSKFLSSLEEENLVGVHPIQYTADEKKGSDFGVMILYKTIPKED